MTRERITRRTIVKAGGGGALTLIALGAGRAGLTQAQEASPAASPEAGGLVGTWVTVRSRTLTGDVPADEVLPPIAEGYLPLLAPARKAFVQEKHRTVGHGGASIGEIIVPLVQIARSSS